MNKLQALAIFLLFAGNFLTMLSIQSSHPILMWIGLLGLASGGALLIAAS